MVRGSNTPDARQRLALELNRVSVRFDSRLLLDSLTFRIEPGRAIGIVGANGSGKSTLARVITGFLEPTSGYVRWGDNLVTGMSADAVSRLGISYLPQRLHLAWNSDVLGNLRIAAAPWRNFSWIDFFGTERFNWPSDELAELLGRLGLTELVASRAARLSYGQRRLVQLGRALLHWGNLLVLDEPFHGLKDQAAARVEEALLRESTSGRSLLIIEHEVERLRALGCEIWTLSSGGLVTDGDLSRRRVRSSSTMGRESPPAVSRHQPQRGPRARGRTVEGSSALLHVRAVTGGYGTEAVIRGADLEVLPGDVIGIIGDNGSGKSTLLRLLMALLPRQSGSITLDDVEIGGMRTFQRARMGLRYLPQDFRLVSSLTVSENRHLWISGMRAPLAFSESDIPAGASRSDSEPLHFKMTAKASSLSGGEAGRAALGMLDIGDPRLILLDEPMAGIDSAGQDEIFDRIDTWSSAGLGVVVVEHNTAFLHAIGAILFELREGKLRSIPA